MKIAVTAGLLTKRYMEVNARQLFFNLQFYMVDLEPVMATKKYNLRPAIFITLLLCAVVFPDAFCQPVDTIQHRLIVRYAGKDSSFSSGDLQLKNAFGNQPLCLDYINKLPSMLRTRGYLAASIDSIWLDSTSTTILLFPGPQQKWIQLTADSVEKNILAATGFLPAGFNHQPVNFLQVQALKERILDYYENNGHPFAAVSLDSFRMGNNEMNATLHVQPGPLYHIDSIRVFGKGKISNYFLQRYLGIVNGSNYSREKLEKVNDRILELPYVEAVQPSDVTLLGTGSVLNLYLQPKRSSQVNFLIGFLPANNQTGKLQLTGDVNLNLKNTLGAGETIALNWQQLQLGSPRLNIGYQHPYIFKSAFGIDFSFGLFKKDSTFLQLNARLGVQYLLSARQSGKLFIEQQKTTLLASGIDTNQVKFTKVLPPNIDVNAVSVGVSYEWSNTNYRFNPRTGNEFNIVGTVGMKTIEKNNDIISLSDPSFNYASLYDSIKLKTYQLRFIISGAHYFPVAKRSTLKLQVNTGLFSSPTIFRNELFQIGGFKLLRGFDEESIYATRYAVLTAEYRYLLGLNSYMFGFIDAARVQNKFQEVNVSNNFISGGIGLLFETKFGLLNMSFAVGKRSDVNLDLKSASKIHFGYINYF